MATIEVLGVDLGKPSFHVIGRDTSDHTILRKELTCTKLIERIANTPSRTI